jgi:hypothetical protein
MRTTVRKKVTSFGTFLSRLFHEFRHHLDFKKFGFAGFLAALGSMSESPRFTTMGGASQEALLSPSHRCRSHDGTAESWREAHLACADSAPATFQLPITFVLGSHFCYCAGRENTSSWK